MTRLALLVVLTSSGCISYAAQRRADDKPIRLHHAVLFGAAELATGTLLGLAMASVDDRQPADQQLGTPGCIALGNVGVTLLDALTAMVMTFDENE